MINVPKHHKDMGTPTLGDQALQCNAPHSLQSDLFGSVFGQHMLVPNQPEEVETPEINQIEIVTENIDTGLNLAHIDSFESKPKTVIVGSFIPKRETQVTNNQVEPNLSIPQLTQCADHMNVPHSEDQNSAKPLSPSQSFRNSLNDLLSHHAHVPVTDKVIQITSYSVETMIANDTETAKNSTLTGASSSVMIEALVSSAGLGPGFVSPSSHNLSSTGLQQVQSLAGVADVSEGAVEVTRQALVEAYKTKSGISVRLDPPEMGRVFIDFQFDRDGSVKAIIRSEILETSYFLKDKADILQSFLKDQGISNADLSFDHQRDFQQSQGQADEPARSGEDVTLTFSEGPKVPELQVFHRSAMNLSEMKLNLKL